MSIYKVEKNVPLPKKRRGREGTSIYPFQQMGVGDLFFVSATQTEQALYINRIRSAGDKLREKGMHFSVRKVEGGVRCWRIR